MKKALAKRIKITGTGKMRRRPMGVDHFRARNSQKSKRGKSLSSSTIHAADSRSIMQELTRIG